MAKWFRSEPMEYISIIINEDASHDCLADLGKLGVIQFTDVRYFSFDDKHVSIYSVLYCFRSEIRCIKQRMHYVHN